MKNIHRAWAVCLGCTLALLVCGGLCINAFSVTQTSMITTACSVTFLLCMFVVNTYYDKLGYRAGLTLAVLLGVGSFVLFAEARTLPGYYLAGMLAGVSHGLGAMLPASILMLRWFSSRRGTAIGICAAGTGISAVVFSPILSALIERFSLRVCFYFEALVSLLAAGLVSSHPGKPGGLRPCPVWNTGGGFFVRKTEALHPPKPPSLGNAVSGRYLNRFDRVARVRAHDDSFYILRLFRRAGGVFLHARRNRRSHGKLRAGLHCLHPLRHLYARGRPVDLPSGAPERRLSAVCLRRKRGFP